MYELIKVSDDCYYIDCPSKIGFVKTSDNNVVLIDSGNNKDAGKKVRKILDEQGWTLCAIYNTHAHADHIGGNRYLSEQTGCRIYAPGIESCFTNYPILEPSFLHGGFPYAELRHKFLMADSSCAEPLSKSVLPDGFEIIELPGHSFDMVGFRTSDDVVYLADCLSSRETLDKYKICFIYDVAQYLETLEKVKTLEAKVFVPSHAPATDNIAPLAQYNIDKVLEVAQTIVTLCAEPISFEALLQKLFEQYELTMNFEQNILVGSTVRSYLSWLKNDGKINTAFDDNMLLWHKA